MLAFFVMNEVVLTEEQTFYIGFGHGTVLNSTKRNRLNKQEINSKSLKCANNLYLWY